MTLHLPAPASVSTTIDHARLSRRGILGLAAAAAVPVIGATPALAATSVVRYTTGSCNVRSGPSTSYSTVGTLRAATRVSGVALSSGWVKIASGRYVSGAVLSSTMVRVYRYTTSSTPVYDSPSAGATRTGTLSAGTRVYGWYTEGQGMFAIGWGRYVAANRLSTSSGPSGTRVISEASEYAGIYYTYGGSSPSTGFDCSGYTQYVHQQLGVSLPRTVADQRAATVPVSTRKVGHLVTFGTYHVAMYAGNGYIWDSSKPGYPIRKRQLWTSDVSYRAVPGVSY